MTSSRTVITTPPASVFENLVLAQVMIFFVGVTWAFGGNADFVEPYLGAWGTLGIALTVSAFVSGEMADKRPRLVAALWPIWAFDVLTGLACLKVGFSSIHSGTELMYLPRQVPFWMPSSALPRLAWWQLWLFNGVYFSAFNLLYSIKTRSRLRALFVVVLVNTLALAVFGTLQKLVHATGIYFGRVHVRQIYFFSTFVYDNHWGAFIILVIGLALGMIWHYADRADDRGFFHSPAFGGTVALLFLFITVPLSGARTCSGLMTLFLFGALIRWLGRRRRRHAQGPLGGWAAPLMVAGAVILVAAATWYLGHEMIAARTEKTVDQLREFKLQHGLGSRSELYHDTWTMAKARIWYGWGMGSFPTVFQMYSSHTFSHVDLLPIFYHDAHSDWLQSIAEHGLIGSALLACCALVPVRVFGRGAWNNRLSRYCFGGCAFVLLYAWMEFPFGNYAVRLTWYLLFFAALRYGVLSPQRVKTVPDAAATS